MTELAVTLTGEAYLGSTNADAGQFTITFNLDAASGNQTFGSGSFTAQNLQMTNLVESLNGNVIFTSASNLVTLGGDQLGPGPTFDSAMEISNLYWDFWSNRPSGDLAAFLQQPLATQVGTFDSNLYFMSNVHTSVMDPPTSVAEPAILPLLLLALLIGAFKWRGLVV